MKRLFLFDQSFDKQLVVGLDEVGRGALAGPIMAAAVALRVNDPLVSDALQFINDSKKLTQAKRELLFPLILENVEHYYIANRSPRYIEANGIEKANHEVLAEALASVPIDGESIVLVDGNKNIIGADTAHQTICQGDSKSAAIACASIIAKVTRDRLMISESENYPDYRFAQHKGYPTKLHKQALKKYGLTDLHRKNFCQKIIK